MKAKKNLLLQPNGKFTSHNKQYYSSINSDEEEELLYPSTIIKDKQKKEGYIFT